MRVIASGTFDRLHEGHKHFLRQAWSHGFVMIAITSDAMLSGKKYASLIYKYRKRRRDVMAFMEGEGKRNGRDYVIKKIHDKYGFATKIRDVDAILVTRKTRANASLINKERKMKGWGPLQIITVSFVRDGEGILSSTRERERVARARSKKE